MKKLQKIFNRDRHSNPARLSIFQHALFTRRGQTIYRFFFVRVRVHGVDAQNDCSDSNRNRGRFLIGNCV